MIPHRRLQLATATVVALVALTLAEGAFGVQNAASLVASASACPGSRSTAVSSAQRRSALLCLINHARGLSGMRRVSTSGALSRGARSKGLDVLRCADFSHEACGRSAFTHVEASGFPFVTAGENLYFAERPAGSARDVFVSWLASPPHRNVMFGSGFSHAGIAVLEVEEFSGARSVSLWVLELAQRA